MKQTTATLILAFCVIALCPSLQAGDAKAEALADELIAACGGGNFAKIKTIEFTFSVGQNGKLLMGAKHHWNVQAGTDTVAWMERSAIASLDGNNTTADTQEAYKRWVNDSYWLLAPLKLRDRGTQLSYLGEKSVDGKIYEIIQLSFESVGLTPRDKYNFYIDPATKLVRRWDYMPSADKIISGTWDEYKEFGGLKLATDHQFGDKRIYFTEIKVENE